jgi:hypothetical protein
MGGGILFENHTLLNVLPGKLDDVLAIFRKSIVPELTLRTGMLGLALLPDWQANQLVIISLWQDEMCAITAGAEQCCKTSADHLAKMILADNFLIQYSLT